jgi:hypothetical protein
MLTVAFAALALSGCVLSPENAREGVAIAPASALSCCRARVAFLLTASTFLRLANLVSDPATSDPIPGGEPSEA